MIASSYFSAQNFLSQGYFYPPRLSFQERTGLFTGLASTGLTPFDGFLCFQTGLSGQNFYAVHSGMWKKISLL